MPRGVFPRTAAHNLANSISKKGQIAPKGDESHFHKLSSKQVEEIRNIYPSKTMRQLSRDFNTSLSNIHRIIHQQIWA